MKSKELYRKCLSSLDPYLREYGFTFSKKEDGIAENNSQEWSHSIYFDPIRTPFGVDIEPMFCFKSYPIHAIWGKFNSYRADPVSVTFLFRKKELCLYAERIDLDFQRGVKDDSTITHYVQSFKGLMEEIGCSIMNTLQTIADFDIFLNQPNPMKDPVQNKVFISKNAIPGLIAARLNDNPLYNTLYEKFLEVLIEFNYPRELEDLKALKAYMDEHSVEELLSL